MSSVKSPSTKRMNWRKIGFTIVLVLIILLRLFEGVLSMAVPWFPQIDTDTERYTAALHVWHTAVFGAVSGLLIAGVCIGLLRRPEEKPGLLQVLLLLGIGVLFLESVQVIRFGRTGNLPFMLFEVIELSLIILFYPERGELLDFSSRGKWSKPLLTLSILTAAILAPDIWRNLSWQFGGAGEEHLFFNHWLWSVLLDVGVILSGVLAAVRRPGWRWLGTLAGLVLLYLGPAATVTQGQAGSWGMTGGIISAMLGGAFIGAVIWEARHDREATRRVQSKSYSL